jgi:hypothetical protein
MGPLSADPKIPFDRTVRPTVRNPKAPSKPSDSARSPSRPKPRRKSGGRSPAPPEPKLRSHQTSVPLLRDPKAPAARFAPPLTPRSEDRAARGVLPIPHHRIPKQQWLETTRPAPLRSEDRADSVRAALPSAVRRPPPVPPGSEDPLGHRRHPKMPSKWGRASFPSGVRRHRRFGTRSVRFRDPRAVSAIRPALSSPRPKPHRFEHLRSLFEKPGFRSARAFPSEAEASSVPARSFRSRSLFRTERAVEMAPRASSPSGV